MVDILDLFNLSELNLDIIIMLAIILFAIGLTYSTALDCNHGVPILTRQQYIENNKTKYNLQYLCLCPADYRGQNCKERRLISCYSRTDNHCLIIDESNVKQSMEMQLSFTIECFVQIEDKVATPIARFALLNNQMNNYGIVSDFKRVYPDREIVWANTTTIFDKNGELNQSLSKEQQQKLLNGNGEYKFSYETTFLGFPLTNSKILYNPSIVRYLKSIIRLEPAQVSISGLQDYFASMNRTYQDQKSKIQQQIDKRANLSNSSPQQLFDELKKFLNDRQKTINFDPNQMRPLPKVTLNLTLKPYEYAEIEMIRIQVRIAEKYNQNHYINEISLNSAKWSIPFIVSEAAKPEIYNSNFYRSTPSAVKFIAALSSIIIIYGLYRLLKIIKTFIKKYQQSKNDHQNFEDQDY